MSARTTRPHFAMAGNSRCAGLSAPKVTVRSNCGTSSNKPPCRSRHRWAGRRRHGLSLARTGDLMVGCQSLQWTSLQSGSEQRVDQEWSCCGVLDSCSTGPLHAPAPISPRRSRLRQCRDANGHTALGKMPGSNIAVTAIIPGTAQDQRGQRPSEAVRRLGERSPCPLHQLLQRCCRRRSRPLQRGASRGGEDGPAVIGPASNAIRSPDATIRAARHPALHRVLLASKKRSRSRRTRTCARTSRPSAGKPREHRLDLRHQAMAGASRSFLPSRQSPSGPRSTPSQPANTRRSKAQHAGSRGGRASRRVPAPQHASAGRRRPRRVR